MTTKRSCNICAEYYNKVNRKEVKCCACDFEACRDCIKKYMLGSKEEPSCMSCKVAWDRNFLLEQLGKTFMTRDYRDYREDLLVEREMGFLQATQPHVEREIRMEQLKEEIAILRKKLPKLEKELKELKEGGDHLLERKKFVRKCPNGDCHGFLSSALKCGLCNCWVCSDCREVKGFSNEEKDAHKCNKDTIESVKLLEKDSKPCPKCTSLIFKIEGCDQMFCVECHTAFSWNTLKIESGVIHNPHFFEYQRMTNGGVAPRNPLEIQCGRELDNVFVASLIDKIIPLPKNWRRREIHGVVTYYNHENHRCYSTDIKDEVFLNIIETCRQVIHVRFVELPRFATEGRLYSNMQLRIDYMRNKITKDGMKKILQKREKDNIKKAELSNVLGMYVACMTDLFYRLYDENELLKIKKEMNVLKKYVNDCLEKISKTYSCKQYLIDDMFHFL